MASLTALLAVAESNAVKLLDSLIPGHELVAKIAITAVATLGSYWGLVIASSRFRSPQGRRLVLVSTGVIGFTLALANSVLEAPLLGGFLGLVVVSLMIGMAGFAMSTTIYNQVDYGEWRKTLAEYYIVSVVGSSALVLSSLMMSSTIPISLLLVAAALASAGSIGNTPVSFSSLKVLDNFATSVQSAFRGKVDILRLEDVILLSSSVGVLAALKLSTMQEANTALGSMTPLVYSIGYAMGVMGSATLGSTMTAPTIAVMAALATLYLGPESSWLKLVLIGAGYGWSVLSLISYVLDKAPKKVRIASVYSVAWTVVASIAVFLSTFYLGVEAATPSLAILGVGMTVSLVLRAFRSRPRWQ